jgi:hypothetical protein
MTPTPLTRDDIIARNLATIADHFAKREPRRHRARHRGLYRRHRVGSTGPPTEKAN